MIYSGCLSLIRLLLYILSKGYSFFISSPFVLIYCGLGVGVLVSGSLTAFLGVGYLVDEVVLDLLGCCWVGALYIGIEECLWE